MDYRGAGLSKYYGSEPWDYFNQARKRKRRVVTCELAWIGKWALMQHSASLTCGSPCRCLSWVCRTALALQPKPQPQPFACAAPFFHFCLLLPQPLPPSLRLRPTLAAC
jgi:hypothetical protein